MTASQMAPASHINFGIYTYKKIRNLSGVTQVNRKSKLPYITIGFQFNSTTVTISVQGSVLQSFRLLVSELCSVIKHSLYASTLSRVHKLKLPMITDGL